MGEVGRGPQVDSLTRLGGQALKKLFGCSHFSSALHLQLVLVGLAIVTEDELFEVVVVELQGPFSVTDRLK